MRVTVMVLLRPGWIHHSTHLGCIRRAGSLAG